MKEITRIHIAKTPYDIETTAKKEIESYINKLEKYANDDELLRDIEIRITELLSERGVNPNGVITLDDVESIRKQLGEPKDFMSDDNTDEYEAKTNNEVTRKLYRNTDNAILGGVLSGIASYFHIDPVIARLGFVLLFLISGGSAFLIYIILWIVVPPARSVAEKLQMAGQPVTLGSIRDLNENEPKMVASYERANTTRRVISLITGSLLLIISLSTLMFTVFVALGIGHFNLLDELHFNSQWESISAYVLAITAGLLLAFLFAIFTYATFTRKFTKRIAVGVIITIVAGLASFSTAVGLVMYQAGDQLQRNIKESVITTPTNFSDIKTLTIDASSMNVDYIVSDKSRITLQSLVNEKKPTILLDGRKANINFVDDSYSHWPQLQPTLTIYGPKLDSLIVKSGNITYEAGSQDIVIESTGQNSFVDLQSGTFGNLTIKTSNNSSINASGATVEMATIDERTGSHVTLGIIKSLSVTQPEACPADSETDVTVEDIGDSTMIYNDNVIKVGTHETSCGSIIINDKIE